MADGRRWSGVVSDGPWGGWPLEVRSHGFPVELYVIALGSPGVLVASVTGRAGLRGALRGWGSCIHWLDGGGPLAGHRRPGVGRRGGGHRPGTGLKPVGDSGGVGSPADVGPRD